MASEPQVKSKRDAFVDRLKGKHPDDSFDDDEALFGRISDDYDDYDQQIGQSREREGKLVKMFRSSPEASRMMNDWAEGKDPVLSFIAMYGQDMVDAANDPEKREQIAAANKEYVDRMTASKQYDEEYQKNLDALPDVMGKVQQEDGLTDEDMDQVMEQLGKIVSDAIVGKFSPETLRMVYKALHHDADVATASEEGEVRGRNTKISEKLRQASASDGTAQLAGRNAQATPKRPELGALANFGDGQDIYARGGFKRIKQS
jgi:hypothetical protein